MESQVLDLDARSVRYSVSQANELYDFLVRVTQLSEQDIAWIIRTGIAAIVRVGGRIAFAGTCMQDGSSFLAHGFGDGDSLGALNQILSDLLAVTGQLSFADGDIQGVVLNILIGFGFKRAVGQLDWTLKSLKD